MIDTEDKRRSAIKILPIPDGTIAGLDRQHAILHYRLQVEFTLIPIPIIGIADVIVTSPIQRVEIK